MRRSLDLLTLSILLLTAGGCSTAAPVGVTPSATAAVTRSSATQVSPSGVTCDASSIRIAGERFFALFNQRKLDDLMTLFLPDALTYYVRRGDPVTSEFKETGTAEIRQMLSERMASGETLQPGPIVTAANGGSTVAVGTFPDGGSRRLDVKYGYDCRRPGIGQLLLTPLG